MAELALAEAEAPESTIAGIADSGAASDEGLSQDALIDKYAQGPKEEAPAETATAQVPGQEPAKPAAEAKPVDGKPAEPAAAQAEEETTQGPLIPGVTPENVQKAFKSLQKWHPDAAKSIREAYFENKGYRETFTLPEARELRTMFSTLQDAKDARGAQADLMAADELIGTNPGALLEYISQKSPEGFMGLALSFPSLLYRANPEAYRERVSGPAVRNYHDFFDAKAKELGNEDVVTAIQILREFEKHVLGERGGTRAQPADPAVLARLNELEAREARATSEAVSTFRDAVDADFNDALTSEVSKIIEGSGADLSEAARQDVIEDVLEEVKNALLADQVLQQRLDWSLTRGARDTGHRQQLNELLSANARRFLGPAASKFLSRMTREILRANAGRLEKAATVAPTRNVGGGATPGSSPKQPLTKTDIDKMTEDEIITAAAEGRL